MARNLRGLAIHAVASAWLLSCRQSPVTMMPPPDGAQVEDARIFTPDASPEDLAGHPDLLGPDTLAIHDVEPSTFDSSTETPDTMKGRKRIFHFPNGSLGQIPDATDPRPGVEVADELCARGAADRKLGGRWKAWISSSTTNAIDRIEDVGPWYRLDQVTKLFENKTQLKLGPLATIAPPGDVRATSPFWTGTLLDGTRSAFNCMDWRRYWEGTATVGRADAVGATWVAAEPHTCSYYGSLLCIEQ